MCTRTIKVTGTGRVSLKPDISIVDLRIENVLPTYELALKSSADDVAVVKNAIERAGIKRDTLKTTRFDIDAHYHSVKDENGNYKSVFDGWEYEQNLTFQFDVDNKVLGAVLYQLSKLDLGVQFRFRYGIKDVEASKNMLLGKAVEDAMTKAHIIAKTANVELGEILDINYSWLSVDFYTRDYDLEEHRCLAKCSELDAGAYDIDISPEDIERSDNVTIVYSIK